MFAHDRSRELEGKLLAVQDRLHWTEDRSAAFRWAQQSLLQATTGMDVLTGPYFASPIYALWELVNRSIAQNDI
jgi:hypothetical protein